jgi:CBS domain-containing protein
MSQTKSAAELRALATSRCATMSSSKSVREAKQAMAAGAHAVVLVDNQVLVGLCTRRDLRFEADSADLHRIMTPRERLVSIRDRGDDAAVVDEARALLNRHRLKRVLLVDDSFRFMGAIDELALMERRLRSFAILPFQHPYVAVYQDQIKPALENRFSVSVQKADEIFSPGSIIEQIQEQIRLADFLVADVSEQNPNVYYEVGYAQALSKEIIFLTTSIDRVPFDIRHRRCIVYTYDPRGVVQLEHAFVKAVAEMLGRAAQ